MEKTLIIKGLSYEIPHAGIIIEDINLELGPGDFVGVLGHNGTGKTTLIDLIMGFRGASRGCISVLGEDPRAASRKNKSECFYVSHEVVLKGNISIEEYLNFISDFYPNFSMSEARRLLQVFSLDLEMQIGALSIGQQKKILIISAIAVRPKLLIVDEITAVLDPETRDLFFRELKNLQKLHSSSIILATNIAEDLVGLVDRVVFIKDKHAEHHSPDKILNLFNVKSAA